MTRPDPEDTDILDERDVDHPPEREGAELVGVSTAGAPLYYDLDAGHALVGSPAGDDPTRHEAVDGLESLIDDLESDFEAFTERAHEIFAEEDDGEA